MHHLRWSAVSVKAKAEANLNFHRNRFCVFKNLVQDDTVSLLLKSAKAAEYHQIFNKFKAKTSDRRAAKACDLKTFGSDDGKARADRHLIRMRTSDNPHLPPDFIERLEANYDPSLLRAYLDGEFVNLTTGQVYDRFDRSKHVFSKLPAIDREPLRIGIDFNVGNMSAVIAIRDANRLTVIDEISGAHDTDALAHEIRRRYKNYRIYIYPDASGSSRSTNATQTDIQILESYGFSNQSPRANPPVRDRVAAVQALLENGKGQIRIQVHQSCKRLIECLELQSYTDKGEPDKDAGFDHMNDALGYLVWREFNPLHANAGRSTGIRVY